MNFQPNHQKTSNPIPQQNCGCKLCANKISYIDYKDISLLKQFLSYYMKLQARRRTKLCLKHQKKIAKAIKIARIMALLPFVKDFS